jgi:hypothetical protein
VRAEFADGHPNHGVVKHYKGARGQERCVRHVAPPLHSQLKGKKRKSEAGSEAARERKRRKERGARSELHRSPASPQGRRKRKPDSDASYEPSEKLSEVGGRRPSKRKRERATCRKVVPAPVLAGGSPEKKQKPQRPQEPHTLLGDGWSDWGFLRSSRSSARQPMDTEDAQSSIPSSASTLMVRQVVQEEMVTFMNNLESTSQNGMFAARPLQPSTAIAPAEGQAGPSSMALVPSVAPGSEQVRILPCGACTRAPRALLCPPPRRCLRPSFPSLSHPHYAPALSLSSPSPRIGCSRSQPRVPRTGRGLSFGERSGTSRLLSRPTPS